MTMHQVRSLLTTELAAMFDGEQRLLAVLDLQARQTPSADAGALFSDHRYETERQIENLRGCFALLGEPVPVLTNHAVVGLAHQREAFLLLDPAPELLLLFDLGAAAKTEHFEIASYMGLLRLAHLLDEERVALLLTENLRQEQLAASKVERLLDEQLRRRHAAHATEAREQVPIARTVEPEVHQRAHGAPSTTLLDITRDETNARTR